MVCRGNRVVKGRRLRGLYGNRVICVLKFCLLRSLHRWGGGSGAGAGTRVSLHRDRD